MSLISEKRPPSRSVGVPLPLLDRGGFPEPARALIVRDRGTTSTANGRLTASRVNMSHVRVGGAEEGYMLRVGLAVIVALLFFAVPSLAQSSHTVMVERVVDDDTVEVSPAVGGTDSVRLIGVDILETVDPNESVQS